MQADTDHNGFAQWVRQIFEHGFSLDGDTRAYMAQTFGSTDLSVVLEKGDESETAALLELIFSPDTVMRLTFEAQWGLVRFRPEQVAALFTALTVQPLKTHIFSDTNHSGMALLVPAFGVSAFIRRLNLTWQPPEALDVFLKAGPAHTNPIAIRDRFRHARVRWAAHRVELVTAYLKQVTHKAADINDGLVFLLSILDEFESRQSPLEFLMGKKRFYVQAFGRAADFERRRRGVAMELLMMQGERAAHGSTDEWRAAMRRVDAICHVLFGRALYFSAPAEDRVDFPSRVDAAGVARLMGLGE